MGFQEFCTLFYESCVNTFLQYPNGAYIVFSSLFSPVESNSKYSIRKTQYEPNWAYTITRALGASIYKVGVYINSQVKH